MNVFARLGAVAGAIFALAAQAGTLAVAPEQLSARSTGAVAKAQDTGGKLAFINEVTWHYDNAAQEIVFDTGRLENQSTTTTSGDVKIQLVLTQSHVPSTLEFAYHVAAKFRIDPLPPRGTFPMKNLSLRLLETPDGVYYASIVAFEQEVDCVDEDGFCAEAFQESGKPIKVDTNSFALYTNANPKTQAVEFFHSGFGHYFMTAQQDEIAALDQHLFGPEWSRTGETWNVWVDGPGLFDDCRFFTEAFAPKSSHFYTANYDECQAVKLNPIWIYEKVAFKVAQPDKKGICQRGIPLHRLYNDGKTGAPNHRYTTNVLIRAAMIQQGFIPEDDNLVCVPP